MNTEATQARRKYAKEYRKKNKDQLNAYRRKWAKENPDKVKKYQANYWKKKAEAEADTKKGCETG